MLLKGLLPQTITHGLFHCCPKGRIHSMINSGTENLVFFAVVPKQ